MRKLFNPETRNLEKKTYQVIFLWNYLNWGGAQIYFLSIVKHAPENWKFKLVIPRKSPDNIIEFFKRHGAEVEFLDALLDVSEAPTLKQKIKRQWRRIHSEISAYRYISSRQMNDTVLHIETAPWQSWILIKLLARRTKVFITMHNSMPAVSTFRSLIWKLRLRYLSRINNFRLFTSNQDTKKSLKPWVTDDFWKKIRVTYTCVDPGEIEAVSNRELNKAVFRQKFGIAAKKFVVLCVGQFIDRKGRVVFLEAAKNLLETDENFHFLWLTQTELKAEDFELIESFELGASFGLVKSDSVGRERTDILKFFQIADVFALPSFVEGLPIALLEAMALGIPSISTNVNAIPEAVIHEQTGLLIEARNSGQLTEAVKKLKNEPALRKRLSVEGKNYVLKHFDERVCAKTVLANYEAALQGEK